MVQCTRWTIYEYTWWSKYGEVQTVDTHGGYHGGLYRGLHKVEYKVRVYDVWWTIQGRTNTAYTWLSTHSVIKC